MTTTKSEAAGRAIPAASVPSNPQTDQENTKMMTHPTYVPVPDGADETIEPHWEADADGDTYYRCVWSPAFGGRLDIRAVVTQFVDGSIGTEDGDAPLVYIGCEDFAPDDARAIAAAIIRVADLADKWVGR